MRVSFVEKEKGQLGVPEKKRNWGGSRTKKGIVSGNEKLNRIGMKMTKWRTEWRGKKRMRKRVER